MSDGERRRPWWAYGCSAELTPRDVANMRRLNVWTFVAMFAWLAVLWTMTSDRVTSPLVILLVIVPVLALMRTFQVAVRFLREADELTRRIQVEAMAVGFGAAFAASFLERFAEEAVELLGGGPWLGELPDLFMPLLWLVVAYSVSVIRLQRHYCR